MFYVTVLPANIGQWWKILTMTNTLAYKSTELNSSRKKVYRHRPRAWDDDNLITSNV
jgi:hypothetical protein